MSASRHLSGLQFEEYHDPDTQSGHVYAMRDDEPVAHLSYLGNYDSGQPRPQIGEVKVYDKDARGQGIGTALYQRAHAATGGRLMHAPERTDDGERFAQKMGGIIPPREYHEDWD
jgi:predicted GNAT family N-acyltransferase